MNQAWTVTSEASMLNTLKKTRGWPCDTSNQWMQLPCTELPIFKFLWGKDKNLQLSFADMNEDELDHTHKSEVDLVWRKIWTSEGYDPCNHVCPRGGGHPCHKPLRVQSDRWWMNCFQPKRDTIHSSLTCCVWSPVMNDCRYFVLYCRLP